MKLVLNGEAGCLDLTRHAQFGEFYLQVSLPTEKLVLLEDMNVPVVAIPEAQYCT